MTIQYISHLYGNVLRRAEIQQNWMFQCGCVELLRVVTRVTCCVQVWPV